MIHLSYDGIESCRSQTGETPQWPEVDEWDLRLDYFFSQVRFIVNGLDFSPLGKIPMYDFAFYMRGVVRKLKYYGREYYEALVGSDPIFFERDGDSVKLILGDPFIVTRISYSDLVVALDHFAATVASDMIDKCPALQENPLIKDVIASLGKTYGHVVRSRSEQESHRRKSSREQKKGRRTKRKKG